MDQRSHSDRDYEVTSDGDPTPEQIERWRQLDAEAANKGLQEMREFIAEVRRDMAAAGITGPHLISVDELRAAGALDVPAAWRKSLGPDVPAERDLFSGLLNDESPATDDGNAASDD
jgi:hypothetical protein